MIPTQQIMREEALAAFREQLLAAIPFSRLAGSGVTVDLTGVAFINNHGLSALREAGELARRHKVTLRAVFPEFIRNQVARSTLACLLPDDDGGQVSLYAVPEIAAAVLPTPVAAPKCRRSPAPPSPAAAEPELPACPTAAGVPPPAAAETGRTAAWYPALARFRLRGDWPDEAAAELKSALGPLLEAAGTHLVLDLRELTYIEAQPLQELARFYRLHCSDGGTLAFYGGNDTLQRQLARMLDLARGEARAVFGK